MPSSRNLQIVTLAAALSIAPLRADVTLRYKNEFKMNPSLPPVVTQPMSAGIANLPAESLYQLKDGKGRSSFGQFQTIVDFGSRQMTMIDPKKQRYSTMEPEQFAEAVAKSLAQLPPEAKQILAQMKFDVASKVTGRSAKIQGIEADEREAVMTVEGPPLPNMPPGPLVRMVMQFWMAKDSETSRLPALRELKTYNLWAYATMSPGAAMEKVFQAIPGMSDGASKFLRELRAANNSLLRAHVAMFMPVMAALMKQMPKQNNAAGAAFDPDSAVFELDQEVAEISTAPVPDNAFQIPEGYQLAPADDLLHDLLQRAKPATPAAPKQ